MTVGILHLDVLITVSVSFEIFDQRPDLVLDHNSNKSFLIPPTGNTCCSWMVNNNVHLRQLSDNHISTR